MPRALLIPVADPLLGSVIAVTGAGHYSEDFGESLVDKSRSECPIVMDGKKRALPGIHRDIHGNPVAVDIGVIRVDVDREITDFNLLTHASLVVVRT